MFSTVHETVAKEHFQKMSLEEILGTAFKIIFSDTNLPDNPFPILYRTVNFYKVGQDIEKAKAELKEHFSTNELNTESYYGIHSIPSTEGMYGIKALLELLDPDNIITLRKILASTMIDIENEKEDVKFDVTHVLSGGYLMKSALCQNPESSPEPILIYSVFRASSKSFESAYDEFFEYIHEDFKAMTRIDLEFNIFQKLVLSYRDSEERIRKKKFILEEILNNKTRMHSEIMNSVKSRQMVSTQIFMRLRDQSTIGASGARLRSRGRGPRMSGYKGLQPDEDEFEYIPVKKIYIFHFVEKKDQDDVNFISYAHSSLCALVEGVFSSKEAAENYAAFYMRKTEEIDKKKLSDYLENKYAEVFSYYYKNQLVKALWGIVGMVLVETDAIRFQILENIFSILSHPVSHMLHLVSISRTIVVLIIAYQNYGLSQFKNAIHRMFDKLQRELTDIMATGFCPEVLSIRKYFDVLLSSISGDNRKELEIDIHSLEAFKNIAKILSTISNSVSTQIIDQIRVTKSSIDIVLNIMRENTSTLIVTQREFIEKKRPDQVVVMKDEIDQVSKHKRYPAKWAKEYTHMQYICDTYSFESLYFILRDIIMSPLYPNSLALWEYKLQGHWIRFDVYGGISDELIIESDFNKPYKNPQPPTNMFIVGDNEMRDKGIPFSISDYHTLFAASSHDIGLFRKFFKSYEWSRVFTSEYEHLKLETLLSLSGYSIFNKYKRLKKQTPLWHTSYDFIFTGMSFDVAMENFTELLIKYAVFLHKESDAIVSGFYSDSDPDSPALTVYKVRNQDDIKNASERLFEYFNNKIRLYLRILTPVESTFKMVKIYFNMHVRVSEEGQCTSLLPITIINDIAKVYFTLNEFVLWDKVVKSQPLYSPTEHLLDEYKNAYLSFRLMDAIKCRILLQILDENIDNITHFMRLLYSEGETLLNSAETIHIVYELISDYMQNEVSKNSNKKVKLPDIFQFYKMVVDDIEVNMLDNHNIVWEGNHIKIINHIYEINKFFEDIESKEFPENIEFLELIMKKIKGIEADLKVMSNIAVLYCSDYLKNVYIKKILNWYTCFCIKPKNI